MSALLTSLALASSVAAAISLYLGAPRQQWLTKPWPTRLSIKAGSILMLTAFGLWVWERTPATAFFTLLAVEMGIFAALPFLAPLQKQIPRYSGINERFWVEFRSRWPSPTSFQQAARKCGEHRWLNWTATYLVTIAVQISTVFSVRFGEFQQFSARFPWRWPKAPPPQKKTASVQGIQRDWLSKALAGALLGFSLAMALSGIVAWLEPGGPAATNKFQLVMWLVSPIWLGVLSFCWLFRSGQQAWLQLGAANLLAFAGLYFSRYLSAV